MYRKAMIALAAGAMLALAGCKEDRESKERIAETQAMYQRWAAEKVAQVQAETQRLKNKLDAETAQLQAKLASENERERTEALITLAKIGVVTFAIGGVTVFVVYTYRRIREREIDARRRRHEATLAAMLADQSMTNAARREIFKALTSSTNSNTPRLGYTPKNGGDA